MRIQFLTSYLMKKKSIINFYFITKTHEKYVSITYGC